VLYQRRSGLRAHAALTLATLAGLVSVTVKAPWPQLALWLTAFGLLFLGLGCTHVASSAVMTSAPLPPSVSAVRLSATQDPVNGVELGIVEAHGRRPPATLSAVAAEFSSRVGKLGGDYGRIDSFATHFEIVADTYTYECGYVQTVGTNADGTPITSYISQTCTGYQNVEVGTLTLTGRAFRTQLGTPKP
jgi:hypothetical protein